MVGGPNADIAVLYGGINNMFGAARPEWAELRPMFLEGAKMLIDEHKDPDTHYLIPTLQPCGKNYLRYKLADVSIGQGITWVEAFEYAALTQARQDTCRTFLMDTLKVELADAGFDTSRVFIYDLFPTLVEPLTWEAGDLASTYPLDLGSITGTPTQADSTLYSSIRFLRPEIESDSIHTNMKGLRQLADSMAMNCFGVDLATWTAGPSTTLYVGKTEGHNWLNRMKEQDWRTPLSTLVAATYRAWPGDSIAVIGSGNQALIRSDSYDTGAGYAVESYETAIIKTGLRVGFGDDTYYDTNYHATYGGFGWFNAASSTVRGSEMDSTLPEWPASATAGVDYPVIDFDLRLEGLKYRGYQAGSQWQNASGLEFVDCILKGGSASSGGLNINSWGDELEITVRNCVFYTDSNSYQDVVSSGRGALTLRGATGAAGDSSTFTGTIIGCSFYGEESATAASALAGFLDGVAIVGNTFDDPAPYQYGWVGGTRTDGQTGNFVLINNDFITEIETECRIFFSSEVATNADSLVLIGNRIDMQGHTPHASTTLYRGPITAARSWVDGNIVSQSTNAIQGYTLATLVSSGIAFAGRNWAQPVTTTSDTLRFGGEPKSYFKGEANIWYGLDNYDEITTGTSHASVGVAQYFPNLDYLRVGQGGDIFISVFDLMVMLKSSARVSQTISWIVSPTVSDIILDELNLSIWHRYASANATAEDSVFVKEIIR